MRFLGVAGFSLRLGSDVVLTAPLYSNPPLVEEAFALIFPDKARIDRFHPETRDVKAILVGHAHYDHLMDVPYVWARTPGARIYGSRTTKNILASYSSSAPPDPRFDTPVPAIPSDRVIALNDKVDTRNCGGRIPSRGEAGSECADYPRQDGEWETVTSTLRIRALCARHPPQFLWIHQAPGCVNAPSTRLPVAANDYREGEPFAYLIDFLRDGRPVFRVYFQDVPSDGPFGRVPEILFDGERRVDLALLCVGNWNLVENRDAEKIIGNLKPQHVMLGHWENFFHDQASALEPAPLQPVNEYYARVQAELRGIQCPTPPDVVLPAPQLQRNYSIGGESCR